jgi:hypothetical protein
MKTLKMEVLTSMTIPQNLTLVNTYNTFYHLKIPIYNTASDKMEMYFIYPFFLLSTTETPRQQI